ncbi:[FeFe] hydrogenase H-cluster radical SAM maturase HydE [Clostridium felsineum]|uniref:[FeFe] hydrogenase H-cluster radical SAM maturase HydE n=1 Tax=Clostridium felsineum TaxID=36839 RepID=UPI00214D6A4B|nr:[FeFe] hydrogenase H-cluster radical SAM maturase HydE [Clostridium felsineum]MCR3760941.1 [FeFe] hydrogenase H-cluster radical SAM maturase HydE [Clostridium felsineum]
MNIDLINKAELKHNLTKAELISILQDNSINSELFKAADRVRKKYLGDEVHLRGIIEFSNNCKRDCLYCGLRVSNKNIKRYRLKAEEIVNLANRAVSYGYRSIVLQSGEDEYYNLDMLKYIIKNIKSMGVAVTLSLGEKSFAEYKYYREAGADRYLLRIETTDRELYDSLDPGMLHENRKMCLESLKKLGYEVGTGNLVGLPNQTIESIAEDILFFKKMDADMIGLGPFIANEDTPLKKFSKDNFWMSIKVMSLVRLLLPNINIPATTAMESLNKNGRIIALQSGANVVMPNITEGEYRKLYAIYPGKICVNETPNQCFNCIIGKIGSIGRVVSKGLGSRRK